MQSSVITSPGVSLCSFNRGSLLSWHVTIRATNGTVGCTIQSVEYTLSDSTLQCFVFCVFFQVIIDFCPSHHLIFQSYLSKPILNKNCLAQGHNITHMLRFEHQHLRHKSGDDSTKYKCMLPSAVIWREMLSDNSHDAADSLTHFNIPL